MTNWEEEVWIREEGESGCIYQMEWLWDRWAKEKVKRERGRERPDLLQGDPVIWGVAVPTLTVRHSDAGVWVTEATGAWTWEKTQREPSAWDCCECTEHIESLCFRYSVLSVRRHSFVSRRGALLSPEWMCIFTSLYYFLFTNDEGKNSHCKHNLNVVMCI